VADEVADVAEWSEWSNGRMVEWSNGRMVEMNAAWVLGAGL
jgi:hypothetical protein